MGRARGIQQEAFRLFACLTSAAHQAFYRSDGFTFRVFIGREFSEEFQLTGLLFNDK